MLFIIYINGCLRE